MTALLDTHILIWWLNDSNRLSPNQQEVVASASAESPLLVSDISLWEVATLHSLGRIQLTIPLREWLDKALAPQTVDLEHANDQRSVLCCLQRWFLYVCALQGHLGRTVRDLRSRRSGCSRPSRRTLRSILNTMRRSMASSSSLISGRSRTRS